MSCIDNGQSSGLRAHSKHINPMILNSHLFLYYLLLTVITLTEQ